MIINVTPTLKIDELGLYYSKHNEKLIKTVNLMF